MTKNRSRFKFVASVALVFSVGALTGVLGAGLYFESRMEKLFHGRPPHGERILERLSQDLDLTREQQEKIRPVLMAFDRKASDLKEQFRPQMEALHTQVAAQIRARLDDSQQKKFDEINERLERRFKERHGPPRTDTTPSTEQR